MPKKINKPKPNVRDKERKKVIQGVLKNLGMTPRHYGWSEMFTYARTVGLNMNAADLHFAFKSHPTVQNGLARAAKGDLIPLPTAELKRLGAKQKANMTWEQTIRAMPMQTPGARKNPVTEAAWENARNRGRLQRSRTASTSTVIPRQVTADDKTGLDGQQSMQMENPKRYDVVGISPHPRAMLDKNGLTEFIRKYVPASQQRDLAFYIHKHQHEASTTIELAQRYLDVVAERQIIREAEAIKLSDVGPGLVNDESIIMPTEVVAEVLEEKRTLNQPLKLHSSRTATRIVEQRDTTAHLQFVEWVWANFADRCAVTGWKNGERLQAAHIEPATSGNFSADNGLLLTPTMHDLMDAGLMAVNPETITVHFAPGIELGVMFEGKVIKPKLWPLNKVALAKRWEKRKF